VKLKLLRSVELSQRGTC